MNWKNKAIVKKLFSTAFGQDHIMEAELMDHHPTPDCTISLKLKSSRANYLTVKKFEIVVKNVFLIAFHIFMIVKWVKVVSLLQCVLPSQY